MAVNPSDIPVRKLLLPEAADTGQQTHWENEGKGRKMLHRNWAVVDV